MPKILEERLKREYRKLPKNERDRAVYGTMNKIGAMKGSKETSKGEKMEKALERKKR